jgi:hypothetical protein
MANGTEPSLCIRRTKFIKGKFHILHLLLALLSNLECFAKKKKIVWLRLKKKLEQSTKTSVKVKILLFPMLLKRDALATLLNGVKSKAFRRLLQFPPSSKR